jgi:phosphoribosylaminoimidazole-succinocarboxamide synthase
VENSFLNTKLSGLKFYKSGKVRDIYDLDDRLLIIATDRVSAFDVVLPNDIPCKGEVLTSLSLFWFDFSKDIIANHTLKEDLAPLSMTERKMIEGRAMVVKKTKPFPAECIVRGYLSGSAWNEYQRTGTVAGIKLAGGLKESQKLEEPLFTPSTKSESGHDINITFSELRDLIGSGAAKILKDASLNVYRKAADYAWQKGIIIADTKFEFGLYQDQIILIDEILTPDSSRFWAKESYQPGRSQPSFDKQYIRDYLEGIKWNKTPPAPVLPPEIIQGTTRKYLEARRRITGADSNP